MILRGIQWCKGNVGNVENIYRLLGAFNFFISRGHVGLTIVGNSNELKIHLGFSDIHTHHPRLPSNIIIHSPVIIHQRIRT